MRSTKPRGALLRPRNAAHLAEGRSFEGQAEGHRQRKGSCATSRRRPTIHPLSLACMFALGGIGSAAVAQQVPEEVVVTGSRITNTNGM